MSIMSIDERHKELILGGKLSVETVSDLPIDIARFTGAILRLIYSLERYSV